MPLKPIAAALLAGLALAGVATAQVPQEARARPVAPAPAAASTPPSGAALTKADAEAWLDGYIPYVLARADIAGAQVVVVKDGQVLTEKGYGYADVKAGRKVDPVNTVFRPGSISKLFTWTAVMQQVEAGRIDLDADINNYLDFKVAPLGPRPITMRDLMTHTAGFAESIKHALPPSPSQIDPLGRHLARWVPNRIHEAGKVAAYSNYGAALAGYIVERVSGETFDHYVDRHIMKPLGMNHSGFAQPAPPAIMAAMSQGYRLASQPPLPYEYFSMEPPATLWATGDDMARFMIAHLNDGQLGSARILSAATAQAMHAPQKALMPPLEPMALGFEAAVYNGRRVIGHGGDTVPFHSDLHLLLAEHVGLYLTLNSAGSQDTNAIREAVWHDFMDRYYPATPPQLATVATAKAHAAMIAGAYRASRRADTGFLRALYMLIQQTVSANPDGTIVVSGMNEISGGPMVWRETGPFVWTDASGKHTLAAQVKDGKVVAFGTDDIGPTQILERAPGWSQAGWNLPLLVAMVAGMLVLVALWPIQALVRRQQGRSFPLSGRTALLYRLVRLTALVDLVALAGYAYAVSAVATNIGLYNDAFDPWLRVLQLLCLIGVAGAALSVWNAVRVWGERGRSWWAKASVTLTMAILLAFVWFVAVFQLVTPGVNY